MHNKDLAFEGPQFSCPKFLSFGQEIPLDCFTSRDPTHSLLAAETKTKTIAKVQNERMREIDDLGDLQVLNTRFNRCYM